MADRIPMAQVREAYARWWFTCEAADAAFGNSPESQDAEDLGDFVEATATLRSFGPNPRTFPEHPWSFDPQYSEDHPDADRPPGTSGSWGEA